MLEEGGLSPFQQGKSPSWWGAEPRGVLGTQDSQDHLVQRLEQNPRQPRHLQRPLCLHTLAHHHHQPA